MGSNSDRIGLDNLLHGMKCPCVMDLKMGTRSVESSEQNIMKKVKMAALDVFTRTAFTGAAPAPPWLPCCMQVRSASRCARIQWHRGCITALPQFLSWDDELALSPATLSILSLSSGLSTHVADAAISVCAHTTQCMRTAQPPGSHLAPRQCT